MRKPDVERPQPGSPQVCPDAKLLKSYPSIVDHLTSPVYDGGEPRTLSTLTLRIEEGEIRLALNDLDNERTMYTASSGLQEALGLMETHLKATGGSWRPWKKLSKAKRP